MNKFLPILALLFFSCDNTSWVQKYFLNDFKEQTSEKYITLSKRIIGTYESKFVSNVELEVSFIVTKKDILIKLYKYGSKSFPSDRHEYRIKIKKRGTNSIVLDSYLGKLDDSFFIKPQDVKKIFDFFNLGGEFDFLITTTPATLYNFAINSSNFKYMYESTFMTNE